MLVLLMQYGARPGPDSLLGPLILIGAGACAGAIFLPLLRILIGRTRQTWRGWRAKRRRRRAAATVEVRARAMMSELCPYGWRARITLYEGDAALDEEEVAAPRAPVAIDWSEVHPGTGRPVLVRRVWAQTIGEALDAMVADRRTDETLEQIELRADADGALWPDL